MQVRKRVILLASLVLGLGALVVPLAGADTIHKITFEPGQGYTTGDINGQQGWMKSGPYDVQVATVASFPAAAHYHFGAQTLRMSDAITSGSFGDQTFSPGLTSPAGESPAQKRFKSSFEFGTALATEQVGMHMSVSPDSGDGGRMSYLRFEDQADGVHVFFDDVTNPGPRPTESTFNETDIATLNRTKNHTIKFSIEFKTGPGNDKVTISIDGKKKITGTTWEDYYRYDPEATGTVPTTSKMLFRESGDAHPANAGNGFLVDGLSLSSSH
jgi:hypothetical protein